MRQRSYLSGIHCLLFCAIQLLTPNNLGGNRIRRRRPICSPDIRNVCILKMLRNRALQIDIQQLTYLLTVLYEIPELRVTWLSRLFNICMCELTQSSTDAECAAKCDGAPGADRCRCNRFPSRCLNQRRRPTLDGSGTVCSSTCWSPIASGSFSTSLSSWTKQR